MLRFVAVSPAAFSVKIQFTCTKKEYSAQSTAVIYSNLVFEKLVENVP
jgi:hypothetical protein